MKREWDSLLSKRRSRVYSGVDDTNTVVVEFEFDNLAALEAANDGAKRILGTRNLLVSST